jgi:hypothetical protein
MAGAKDHDVHSTIQLAAFGTVIRSDRMKLGISCG